MIIKFSICTIDGNLCISISRELLPKFLNIFKCDEKGHPFKKQIADDDYFKKLEVLSCDLLKEHPQSYELIKFFKGIPTNQFFLILAGDVNKDSSLNNYSDINKLVYKINNIQYPIIEGKIPDCYNVYLFGNKKLYIGEADKKKRVCRFCKENSSNTTFKNKAHAISESLGNKLLFCNEECDKCNFDFREIEDDLFNIHYFTRSLHNMRGKEGIQNLKGKSIEIDNKNNEYKKGLVSVKTNMSSIDIIDGCDFDISDENLKYSAQNIYRCLCKFAISLIDDSFLKNLSDTILWIRKRKTIINLPPVWRKSCSIHEQPLLGFYVRKKDALKDLPEFVMKLFVVDTEYLFLFPIIDSKPFLFSESIKKTFMDIFNLSEYVEMDLSSDERKPLKISFHIKSQEGVEVMNINKSEYNSFTPEERLYRYPNISVFYINDDSKT